MSRRLLSWIFALTLLFGQGAAFAHALTHLHVDDPAVPDKVCEVCVAQAQLGSAVPPAAIIFAVPQNVATQPGQIATLCVDLAPLPACARAPPTPLSI